MSLFGKEPDLLIQRDKKNLLQNYGDRALHLTHGKGSYLWDAEGKRYLDCVTGIAVNALGHCHPAILQAMKNQMERFTHVSNLYLMESQQELAALLVEFTGFDRVFFSNSGTEANEGAIKFARKYWYEQGQLEKNMIVTLAKSFHGRTYGGMAATGQDKIKKGFGPMPAGFITVDAADENALIKILENPLCAAIMVEPILAEGGIYSLLPSIASIIQNAQAKGVLLIADEIQTGLGRTGPFLGCDSLGLKPDIVTLAKPLGGGLPLGAVLMRQKIADAIHTGDHGSTFGGNPIACAAGCALIKEITASGFLADAQIRAEQLRDALQKITRSPTHPKVTAQCGPILGKGFLTGFHYTGDLPKLLAECRKKGLLIFKAGNNDVVRLLPPLNISSDEIKELITVLGQCLIDLS